MIHREFSRGLKIYFDSKSAGAAPQKAIVVRSGGSPGWQYGPQSELPATKDEHDTLNEQSRQKPERAPVVRRTHRPVRRSQT